MTVSDIIQETLIISKSDLIHAQPGTSEYAFLPGRISILELLIKHDMLEQLNANN